MKSLSKLHTVLATAAIIAALNLASLAQTAEKPKGPDEPSRLNVRNANGRIVNKTNKYADALKEQRAMKKAAGVDCLSALPAPIAFSALGQGERSSGEDTLLQFNKSSDTLITNEGNSFYFGSTFIAPCDGLYFFTISFVKDGFFGTQDDVETYLVHYPLAGGSNAIAGSAWSGEGAGLRGTGAYSVTFRLRKDEGVQSWVHSDSNVLRYLAQYAFTGFRIAD